MEGTTHAQHREQVGGSNPWKQTHHRHLSGTPVWSRKASVQCLLGWDGGELDPVLLRDTTIRESAGVKWELGTADREVAGSRIAHEYARNVHLFSAGWPCPAVFAMPLVTT